MKKLSYDIRCMVKAESLEKELVDDIGRGHIYKTIAAFWEVIELLLRVIIYKRKRATYESLGKLISVFAKLIPPAYSPRLVISTLNTLYNHRKKAVHKAILLNIDDVNSAKPRFCEAIRILLDILEKEGYIVDVLKDIARAIYLTSNIVYVT